MTQRTKRRALGQHFLKSQAVLKKIIRRISPQEQDLIIEIGAGKGALTFPLAEKAGKVIAIEKDPTLIPSLKKKKIPNLIILEKDILKVDFDELLKKEKNFKGRLKLAGNLPYSLSSPILFKVLEERELFTECVFLIQREVAERLCGQPGSKNYAPLSILFQIHFHLQLHFTVPPACFSPPPRVDSALISLKKREQPLFALQNEGLFRDFLKGSFKHRRKILRNNLEKLNIPLSSIDEAYLKFDIERNTRAEQLPISRFVNLFQHFFK
ncbi:MAG: ribosomal RNA small subunit methyltransferase A [Candidatus Aminicenantes bacterium]|nr:MAG: ribosomal RNA small subunit methyltransferase A [Candidatus Aminicenantes bacterium]